MYAYMEKMIITVQKLKDKQGYVVQCEQLKIYSSGTYFEDAVQSFLWNVYSLSQQLNEDGQSFDKDWQQVKEYLNQFM